MKNMIKKITAALIAAVMCYSLVGCSFFDKPAELPELPAPQVTIDENGLASWQAVDNALYYMYSVNYGEDKLTNDCYVQLKNDEVIIVKAVSGNEKYADSDYSQPQKYIKIIVEAPTKLTTPDVTIDDDGIATWAAVDNAQYYVYVLNNGAEQTTHECSFQLELEDSIRVKAISGSDKFTDSDYSPLLKYAENFVQTKLGTPDVTIDEDGLAEWVGIADAQYYFYVINNGVEKKTTELSIQLENNDTIRVKAASYNDRFTDSDYSEEKTYISSKVPHVHTDNNSDGVCDVCKQSVTAELSFYAINDLHGKFMDTSSQPGVDEFTTYMKNLYKDTAREEVLLSSGDMWQGTVESSSNKGQLMTEWMNELGFASMTLGNHEYDWGPATLKPNSELAEFPFLAINVRYNGHAVDYCQGSTTVEKGGIKIGIIGAIGDCLSSISGEFQEGLSFITGNALTELVKTEAQRLRSGGCDFIVYSIHEGYGSSLSSIADVSGGEISYYETSLSNGYVDLVFEGHSHQHYILRDEYGVYHMQGGGENSYVSCADVSYNTVSGRYEVTPRLIRSNEYASSSIKGDAVVQQIFDKYFPDSNPYDTIGYNRSERGYDELSETVAQLYYEKGVEQWGSQYNIVLGGGYLKPRSPYRVYVGDVAYADLFSVLPFDNEIVLGRISGRYLKSKFINNSSYTIYPSILDESEYSDYSYYYIIVDSYTSTYRYNNITEVERLGAGTYARDLLADYVKKGGWGSSRMAAAYGGLRSRANFIQAG